MSQDDEGKILRSFKAREEKCPTCDAPLINGKCPIGHKI